MNKNKFAEKIQEFKKKREEINESLEFFAHIFALLDMFFLSNLILYFCVSLIEETLAFAAMIMYFCIFFL
ncbi:hypothetical protein TUBRATIS_27050, partial [Tubulinosema ratisbonensis]